MSRQVVWRVLAAYLGIAALYGALHVLATPGTGDWRWAAIIGGAIGWTISPLLIGGIIPVIFWAFSRFRAEKARGPIVVWGFLGVVVAILSTMGESYDGPIALSNIPANVGAGGWRAGLRL